MILSNNLQQRINVFQDSSLAMQKDYIVMSMGLTFV
jgi:hypothetical protein